MLLIMLLNVRLCDRDAFVFTTRNYNPRCDYKCVVNDLYIHYLYIGYLQSYTVAHE